MDMNNPVEIFGSYQSLKYDNRTHMINFMNGSQNMYLVEGNEKALLLDTGWGAGNLRCYVEKLTDKPIIVANTHCHPDHAGGNGEWKEVMMLYGGEKDLATCADCPFDISKLSYPGYRHVILSDGDKIDVGGRTLEVLDISAHSNGSMALLDTERQQLFVGDELESAQVIMYESIPVPGISFILDDRLRAHHKNMLRLKSLCSANMTIFPAHNGAPISMEYLVDIIELTEQIYTGAAIIEDKLNHIYVEMGDPEHKLCRVRWHSASFFVVKADLMKIYGSNNL
ncbi:MAG: MBL fold metallo-hydrolase [Mobilitalea sp.]